VPLTFGESQLGVLAIGTTGESVGSNDLETLGELSAAAGALMGAALRLRDSAETAARSAKTARFRSDYASVVSHEPTPGGGATFVIPLPFKPHAGVGH